MEPHSPLSASPYVHRYDLPDGSCAVFHALSLEVAYVGPELRALFPPVYSRPVPFPIPRGGIGDVPPDYEVPTEVMSPSDWLRAGGDPAAVAKLAELHMLQPEGDTFDAGWLGKLHAMVDDSPMRMLTIVPTTLCNFRCTYCHETEESRASRSRMTIDQARALIDAWAVYARRTPGKKDLLLYGGEPMLHPELVRWVIEHFTNTPQEEYGGKVCVILVTNASRMTPEWAAFFKQHDTFVIVSCDAIGEDNDAGRVTQGGAPTFSIIERGYRLLQAAEVRTAISVTVTKHNAQDIATSFPELIDHFKPLDIGLNSCLHPPYGKPENDDACDPLDGTQRMLKAYAAARERGVYVEQFNRRVRPFAMRTHRVKDCSACGGRIVGQPGGKWSFCDGFSYTPEYTFAFEGKLDLETNPDYHRWSQLSPIRWADCHQCPLVALCGGGCRYDAAMASGKLDGLDPHRCTQDREILRWTVQDLSRILGMAGLQGSEIHVPSEAERRTLLGELTLNPLTIPLGNANRYGERVGRPVESNATSVD